MNSNTFGKYIRTLRKKEGLTLVELSKLSGVSNPYLSQIENDQFKPSPDIIRKLSNGLKVDYNDLMVLAGYIEEMENVEEQTKELQKELEMLLKTKNESELELKLFESLKTQEKLLSAIKTMSDLYNVLISNSDVYYKDHLLTNDEKQKILSIIEAFLD